jgi:tetratricopeptide (TPR) repeat protein
MSPLAILKWGARASWYLLRESEFVAVSLAPRGVRRSYLLWRLKGPRLGYKRSSFLCELADLERRRGDLNASETAAREALRDAPDFYYAYVELALTFEAMGRREEARQALQKMLEMPEFDRSFEGWVKREIERLSKDTPQEGQH